MVGGRARCARRCAGGVRGMRWNRLRDRSRGGGARVSELLDRIQREIRERLAASRGAVLEHERLEAALQALGDAGARATRAVSSRGRAQSAAPRPAETTRGSGAAAT